MIAPPSRPLARAALGLLAFTAIVHLGYHLRIGLDPTDVGPFETVLASAVAGHFEPGVGPAHFYGPFSGANPSVLIHAPLYYRLVALAAWPAVALGADPLLAVLYAGRGLAALGTLIAFLAVAGLANLDGVGRRAGGIAVALLAASPILGNLVAMVRPDALGVGLQTLGALLVLRTIADGPEASARAGRRLLLAYITFAVAFWIKQQNLTVAGICTLLLAHAAWQGRVAVRPIALAHVAGAAAGAAYLGLEQGLTAGQMFRSVFVYPGGPFRAINYAGWGHVASIVDITARRSAGLIALVLACLIGLRRARFGSRLDGVLAAFLAVELIALVPLCLFNAGAAYNYALQAIVFACILAGRAFDRLLTAFEWQPNAWARLGPAAAAVLLLMAADLRWVDQTERARAQERAVLAAMGDDDAVAHCPPEARYFVGRHHLNRLFGRADLIHDDWLYGAFEQIEAAPPRDAWLRAALVDGPIRQVVIPGPGRTVPGIAEPLPALGYHQVARHGELQVWERH